MVLQLSKGLFNYTLWRPKIPFLQNFKLKMEFLTTKDVRQVKLPKLPGEAKSRPALVKVGYPFETQHSPKICQTDVGPHWAQLNSCIKRKGSSIGHEAGEGITIEMVSVCWIGSPIGVRIMWRHDFYQTRGFGYSMKLAHKRHDIRNVFNHVAANDKVKFIVGKRIRQNS